MTTNKYSKNINKIMVILISSGLLAGCTLLSPKITDKPITPEQIVSIEKEQNEIQAYKVRYSEIRSYPKTQSCIKTTSRMDELKNELLPSYKELLNKETDGTTLTKKEQYQKYLYNFFEAKSKVIYSLHFTSVEAPSIGSGALNTLNDRWDILQIQYCPEPEKLSLTYPATSNMCYEVSMVTAFDTLPYELPVRSNYNLEEEYNAAKAEFDKEHSQNMIRQQKNIKECCAGDTSISGACSYFTKFMK